MIEHETNPTHVPGCPRCEYDQRGEIATWESQCPICGICPECGLEFEWSQVYAILNEWGSEVDWYAEHGHGWKDLFVRTPKTLLRLVFPSWFFRGVNRRRSIGLWMLLRWMIVVSVLLHIVVSLVGFPANKAVYGWSQAGYNGAWWVSFIDSLCNTLSATTFPLVVIRQYEDGAIDFLFPFMYDEWKGYMLLAWVVVGVSLCWTLLMGAVFLIRWRDNLDRRQEFGLFGRVILLSLFPAMVYVQVVRFGFGIHAATGMTSATNWVPWMYVISILVMIFWQQLIWTHAVRTIWEIKRSFIINIGGCFGSFIGGVIFTMWIL